ncbi:hypothetical protein FE634_15330 [Nocardioides dongxiaopingii]|uniref:hypothetical protein n=1 Tax=Nocardioides sp. S-1144 TaxID=2582905 RepID=UPI00110DC89B|nr:hypothetical protein [Nocardioides sp. S-1144]QCW51432.1 hypothetical protein FE634_15330 [Nocardioides sp. S-1144]
MLALLITTGCGSDVVTPPSDLPDASSSAPPGEASPVVPSDPDVLVGLRADEPRQLGSTPAEVEVATLDGGRLEQGPGPDGAAGGAIDFPDFTTDPEYPRAVVRLQTVATGDVNPGSADLVWGATVKIDAVSKGNAVDNGDNIIQRGLSSDPVIFKAEVDGDRPACLLRGAAGELIVRADLVMDPSHWYTVQCRRSGDTLTVFTLDHDTDETTARQVEGPVGALDFPDATVPVTIGGKLSHEGAIIASSTDQFNGLMSEPYVKIL